MTGSSPAPARSRPLLTAATGVKPLIIGKPEPTMLVLGAERLGLTPAETAIIGDRLDTDIVGGHRAGLQTLLVLTGVSTRAEAAAAEVKPDWVFEDLPALQAAIESGLTAR